MKKLKSTLLLLAFVFIAKINVATPDDLKKGWEAFAKNNRTEAISLFKQALKDPACKAEASLALSIISRDNGNSEESFKYYMDFYKSSENPYPDYIKTMGLMLIPISFISLPRN